MPDLQTEDEVTAGQSNSTGEGEQTSQGTEQNGNEAGQAAEGQGNGEGTSEGASRGEVRHERYIDRLGREIREKTPPTNDRLAELFPKKTYEPIKYEDGESYDPDQLEADRKQVADNKFAEGAQLGQQLGTQSLEMELWKDRFDADVERVTTRFPELDESDTEHYNPKLEEYLVEQYIKFTQMQQDSKGRLSIGNRGVRFKDFAEAEIKNLEEINSARSAQSERNVNHQVAQTGVRPNGQTHTAVSKHGFDSSSEEAALKSLARMTSEQYHKLGGKEASDAYFAENKVGMRK